MHEKMFRSKKFLLLKLLFCVTVGWPTWLAGDDGTSQKVVYHVNFDDSQEQQQTLRYIKNHLNAVGEDKLDLRVILHGDGLTLLLEPDMADNTLFKSGYATDELTASVAALKDRGVRFLVCANTLRGKKVDHENDLYDVIRYGGRIGCDVVNVGRLDRQFRPNLKRPDAREEKLIYLKADEIAQAVGIQLDWLQYSVSHGITRFFYKLLRKKLHKSGTYCLKTFDYAYVTREGYVTPCCLLPNSKMGNLLTNNLKSIWQSGKFDYFRKNYRNTCGECDLWTIDQVDTSQKSMCKPKEQLAKV